MFKFLEMQERMAFPEAVRHLAARLGVQVPETVSSQDRQSDAAEREALLKMHEMAAAFFHESLAKPEGARARQQLRERGVSDEMIERLGLGFAPSTRDALVARLQAQGFRPELVTQSGLVVQREDGQIVDRFRNRLMVPICRDSGSVVAFGGRVDEQDQQPKYLNSPETAIYSKGRTLYGLHLTKAEIRRLGYAVIVEGYFDFAQVVQAGITPVVASCGTALTRAPGPVAETVHVQGHSELRSRCRGSGRRGALVRPARGRGVRCERRHAASGRGSRHLRSEAWAPGVSGSVCRVPDRIWNICSIGPPRARSDERRGPAAVPERDAGGCGPDPRCGRS